MEGECSRLIGKPQCTSVLLRGMLHAKDHKSSVEFVFKLDVNQELEQIRFQEKGFVLLQQYQRKGKSQRKTKKR